LRLGGSIIMRAVLTWLLALKTPAECLLQATPSPVAKGKNAAEN